MSALAQSITSQLGEMGAGYATARDTATEQRNQVQAQQFEQAQRIREFLETQKMNSLQTQVEQSLIQQRQGQSIQDLGAYQDSQGKWYRAFRNMVTGEVTNQPLPGEPESVARMQESQADIDARQQRNTEAITQRDKDIAQMRLDFEKWNTLYRVAHPSGSGSAGAIPLAAQRYYNALNGPAIDKQINILESYAKSQAEFLGNDPQALATDQGYQQTMDKLWQLYQQSQRVHQEALNRAGGSGMIVPTAPVTAPGSTGDLYYDSTGKVTSPPAK